jgi:aminopeptidase N
MHHHILQGLTAPHGAFARPDAPLHTAPDRGLEPQHLHLAIDVDLETRTLVGRSTTRLIARRDGVASLCLDAVDLLDLAVERGGRPCPFTYDGRTLRIELEPVPRGDSVEIDVRWRTVAPPTGLLFSGPDEHEPHRPRFVATDSESERARYWMPCVDHSIARPTLSWEITAASDLTVLANGARTGTTARDDGRTVHTFVLDHPCPSYLACFAVGEFVEHQGAPWRDREVASYTTRWWSPADLERSFGRTTEMIEWLSQRLGVDFPWPKYHQFAVPHIGGAMENISLVSWDERFLVTPALEPENRRLVDQINLHELAHTWFGDLVVCRDFSHVWLKESWATFMEQVWFEECVHRDEAEWELLCNARSYFSECDQRYRRPIRTARFDHSWDLFDMHLYPGGACRLHMLRAKMGEAGFWRGTQRYLREYAGRVAETDDFRRTLEEESGLALTTFFEQFFGWPGFPELTVQFRWDGDRRVGVFRVEQTQKELQAGQPAFHFDVEVMWRHGDQTERRRVTVESVTTIATFPMQSAPDAVRFDPGNEVLARTRLDLPAPLLRAMLAEAADVPGRIYAAEHLIQLGTTQAWDAVEHALTQERFWGVRRAVGSALVRSGHGRGVGLAARLLADESDPRVVEGVFTASLDAPSDKTLARVAVERADSLPPRAQGAALQVAAREDLVRRRALVAQVRDRSDHAFAAVGAAAALARLPDDRGMKRLVQLAAERTLAPHARAAVFRALGEGLPLVVSERLRAAAFDALRTGAAEPPGPVRDSAMIGLAASQHPSAVAALERVRTSIPEQYRPRFDRRLDGLRRAISTPGASTDRIEELERNVRSLRERLTELEATQEAHRDTPPSSER